MDYERSPLLDQLAQTQAQAGGQGLRVLGIAADKAANVTRWLQRQPLSFPVLIAETGGVALTRPVGSSNGGLPFSLLFDGAGQLKQRRIGAFTEEILQRWMAAVAPLIAFVESTARAAYKKIHNDVDSK